MLQTTAVRSSGETPPIGCTRKQIPRRDAPRDSLSSSDRLVNHNTHPTPRFFVSVASKGLRVYVRGLESTVADTSISVDSKGVSGDMILHRPEDGRGDVARTRHRSQAGDGGGPRSIGEGGRGQWPATEPVGERGRW